MKKSRLSSAVCVALVTFITASVNAALIDRGNGLIYDDVLDITWLQNANLAASNTFGLATGVSLGTHPSDSSGFNGQINAGGFMNWPGALHWIDAMNADGGMGYKGYDDWRLPTFSPIDGSSFNESESSNATTDRGFAPTTTDGTDGGWRDGSGAPVSEMGHMYYVNLANLGACDPSLPLCTEQTGWGLNNTSFVDGETGQTVSFDNVQSNVYWSGVEFSSSSAGIFEFWGGKQDIFPKSFSANDTYVWAVRTGDVAAIPLPAALWLFGSGLLGLIGMVRRKGTEGTNMTIKSNNT